jgi:ring-1,2-phenylacetyl-CoA epoxidase subunit PaaD
VVTAMTGMPLARVRRAIEAVEDPELPQVTIGDLGIVRSVAVEGGVARVALTPTFTGCPAMGVIIEDVGTAIETLGLRPAIETVLAPAWSPDWITADGRRKLLEAGIAPPVGSGGQDLDTLLSLPSPCPRCGSIRTRRLSEFGATACKAPHVCDACKEPFEGFKPL